MRNQTPRCGREDCDRPEYFTAEHLCRPHGLAAGADIDIVEPEPIPVPQPEPKALKVKE